MNAPPRSRHPGSAWSTATELLLVLLNAATVLSFTRLFVPSTFDWTLMVYVVVAHAVVAGLRLAGAGIAISAATTGLCTAVAAWLAMISSPLPAGSTASMGDQLGEAWRSLTESSELVVMTPGFVAAAVVTIWMVAWWSDLGAFRLRAALEAVSPSAAVFVVVSLLAAGGPRIAIAAVWFAVAALYALSHRAAELYRHPGWVRRGQGLAIVAAYRSGVVVLIGVMVGAVIVGPLLPSANADPVIDLRSNPTQPRAIPSPLAQVRPDLVDDPDREVFTVSSPAPLYWRLAGLERYDGATWTLSDSFGPPDGPLDIDDAPHDSISVEQSFEITRPDTVFLPAAYLPSEVSGPGADGVRWQRSTATLLRSADARDDSFRYDVVSSVPQVDPGLIGPREEVTVPTASEALSLPDRFPASIAGQAVHIVDAAGAVTPYDKAVALETYLRGGGFTYSLNVRPLHSMAAMETFLFDTRTGYCEQFATAFALLGRSVGLPTRLAVGYTTGTPFSSDPQRYQVRGRDAHVWPEVWLDEAGWVAFEPTPGRQVPAGMETPGSGDPDQETLDASEPGHMSPGPPPPPGSGSESNDGEGEDAGAAAPETADPQESPDSDDESDATFGPEATGLGRTIWLGLVLVVVVAIVMALRAAFRSWQRRRRRLSALTDPDQVAVAWAEAGEDLSMLGVTSGHHETPIEFAERTHADIGSAAIVNLSELFTAVTYSGSASEGWGEDALDLADTVRFDVIDLTTQWQRFRAAVAWRSPASKALGEPRRTSPLSLHGRTTAAWGDAHTDTRLLAYLPLHGELLDGENDDRGDDAASLAGSAPPHRQTDG